jgi:alpha-mannosidase
VRLEAGAERVELSTRLVNRSCDHRLRVHFPDPTGDPVQARAQSAFAVVRRPLQPPDDAQWFEPYTPTQHLGGTVAAGRLQLMARGLAEYEALPLAGGGVELALTLLRAVGWLSRDDLATRRHRPAGPQVQTPDAQGMGERRCEYALGVDGDRDDASLVRAADDYRFDLAEGPGRIDLDGVLTVTGERFACTALKGAEDGDGAILRVYNPGEEPGWIQVGGRVLRCRLDETGGRPVQGRLALGPFEIATLRVSAAA